MKERNIETKKEEIDEIKKLYEGVLGVATTGLLYKTGQILGKKIADISNKERERYFEIAKNILIEKGLVFDVIFDSEKVIVSKSIEIKKSEKQSCHMLRGVLAKLYEEYYNTKVNCEEIQCGSISNEECVFKIWR